ncbi:hypothetical protein WN943_023365 [Citrus x changshan-huyou]
MGNERLILKPPLGNQSLIVGAAAHAAIFMVRDYDPTTRYNDLLDRVLQHRDAITSHLNWTAGDKPEEGEDDIKSSCPLCPRRHTCYNGRDKGSRSREGELTPKTRPQFGLQAATRLHKPPLGNQSLIL